MLRTDAPPETALPGSTRQPADRRHVAISATEAATVGERWLVATINDASASARILVPDRLGRLQPLQRGRARDRAVSSTVAQRREAFLWRRPCVRTVSDGTDRVVALFPLVVGERSVGVIEVSADREAFERSKAALQTVVSRISRPVGDALERARARADDDRAAEDGAVEDPELDLAVAMTAHELRSPLLAVRAAIEAVVSSSALAEATRETLMRSARELEQVSSMADDLLHWAAGGDLRPRAVDLVEVVREAADACRDGSSRDRIAVSGPECIIAAVDPGPFRVAIQNVIRNALDHSPPECDVEVVAGRGERSVTVCVRDRGRGVPAHEREAIFQPFVRGEARSPNGSGLGLFIARRIVDAHGGRLWVDANEGAASGTSFRLEVPAFEDGMGRCAS